MAEITNVSQPTLIPRLQNIDSVVSGFDHCLALTGEVILIMKTMELFTDGDRPTMDSWD